MIILQFRESTNRFWSGIVDHQLCPELGVIAYAVHRLCFLWRLIPGAVILYVPLQAVTVQFWVFVGVHVWESISDCKSN